MTSRSIDSRLWSDGWIRKLNALDRYLFLYLLTNTHSTWCGVYELDLAMMAFESGIDKEDLVRSILPRLAPKAIYVDGWVYVPNWMKYHLSGGGTLSPQQKKGFDTAWNQVPQRIRDKIAEIEGKGYPMVRVSPSSSSFTSSSTYTSGVSLSEESEEDTKISKKARTNLHGFPTFWEVFPKKEDKVSAAAEWRLLSKEDRDAAIADITVRKWEDITYCPLPKTYLKNRRWEDELSKPQPIMKF